MFHSIKNQLIKPVIPPHILKKHQKKRVQTEQRKWRRYLFKCQHCGLISNVQGSKLLTPMKHLDSQTNPKMVASVLCSVLEKEHVSDFSKKSSDRVTCTAFKTDDTDSKDSVGAKFETAKSYLCGKCLCGFDKIEHLVDHVALCSYYGNRKDTVSATLDDETSKVSGHAENLTRNISKSTLSIVSKSDNKTVADALLPSEKCLSEKNEAKLMQNGEKTFIKTRSGRQAGYLVMKKTVTVDGERNGRKRVSEEKVECKTPLQFSKKCGPVNANEFNLSDTSGKTLTDSSENDAGNIENDENICKKQQKNSNRTPNPDNRCSICNKKFVQKSTLYRHQNLVHKGSRKYECKICHKRYQQKYNLKIHRCLGKPVSKSRLCNLCGKQFSSVSALTQHEKTIHTKTKHKCPMCDQEFTTVGNMKEHLKAVHGGRAYLCDLCGRTFSFKNSYNRHQRYHTGVKPYQCQHCQRTFTTREGCQAHVMTHIVAEKVQCEYCGKRMKNLLCVTYHMKKHHDKDEKRGYQCFRCKMQYDDNVSLVQHMEECQKNQHICLFCSNTFSSKSSLTQHSKTHEKG